MAFDALTTAAIVVELRDTITNGRVDKIIQASDTALGILMRAGQVNHWLLLSVHAQHARVSLTERRLSSEGAEPTAFVMLLRKYIEGQRLIAVEQVGLDRVIRFTFPAATLLAEIMGRHSNIVLIEPEKESGYQPLILGSFKRVSQEINRYRVILPRHPYIPPPPPTRTLSGPTGSTTELKKDPFVVTPAELLAALRSVSPDQRLSSALIDILNGIGPQAAKEIAYRFSGQMDLNVSELISLPAVEHLLEILADVARPPQWKPSIARRTTDDSILGWAAYPLQQHGPTAIVQTYDALSTVLDIVYSAVDEQVADASGPSAGPRRMVLEEIDSAINRLQRKVSSLQASLVPGERIAELRSKGELILAFAAEITPGMSILQLADPPVHIELDPEQTPVENAQSYFHRYAKARDAASRVPVLLEETQNDLSFLTEMRVFAELAATPSDVSRIRSELVESGLVSGAASPAAQKRGSQARGPKGNKGKFDNKRHGHSIDNAAGVLRLKSREGIELLVGRSAKQNDLVTFNLAGPNDIWLHARQIPGAHVIVRSAGRAPSDATLREAAELAAGYSQGRTATSVPVDYAPVRNVRRIKGGKPGLVHYSGETTLMVHPRTAG